MLLGLIVLTHAACSSSTLAAVTTVHLGLVALRSHRSHSDRALNALTLVSLLFVSAPWLYPTVPGLLLGLAAHVAWFVSCEALAGSGRVKAASTIVSVNSPAAVEIAPMRRRALGQGFIQVPILATFDETCDMKTIRLARPDDFEFEAGQFITVRVQVDGKEYVRCYSISSAPEVRGYLEVTVKRQGVVSNALHATVRAGATLSIRRPNGTFLYPSKEDRPIVLLAGGVGVTPLMSMLRHAVHSEPTRPVTLIYTAHTSDAFAFRDELATIARRHPQVQVILTATRDPEPPAHVFPGRIDEALLRRTVPDLLHSVACICGPTSMIDTLKMALAGMGMPSAQVRHELFEAAVAASARPQSVAVESGGSRAATEYPMHCSRSERTIAIEAGETLLDAAERGGIDLPSLCRSGVCGTCRTQVTEGDVDCATTTLDPEERAEGFVLACVATARSACTVNV